MCFVWERGKIQWTFGMNRLTIYGTLPHNLIHWKKHMYRDATLMHAHCSLTVKASTINT